jgi:hypothetical protein
MALRLGNDAALGTAAGNLALCYGRLGDYQAQVEWGGRGLQYLGNRFTGYRDIQLGFARAFGNAMLGRVPAAISALSEASARIPATIPKWMKQAWSFERADVLQMLGKKREALIESAAGLEGNELYSNTLAGPFARWLTHHAITTGQVTAARKRLQEFRSKIEIYDAVDQAEILAATCWLSMQSEASVPPARLRAQHRRLADRLLTLPGAVGVQLARLSVLPPAT